MESNQEGYRMVSRSYFCYQCQKKGKKMIQVGQEGSLTCDLCGGGFCEMLEEETMQDMIAQGVVQAPSKEQIKQQQAEQQQLRMANQQSSGGDGVSMLDQLQAQGSSLINNPDAIEADHDAQNRPPQVTTGRFESIRPIDEDAQFRPPQVSSTGQFENPYDMRTMCNTQGRPTGKQPVNQQQEEQKVQQPDSQQPTIIRIRRRNPFQGGGNFMQEFFGDNSPFMQIYQQEDDDDSDDLFNNRQGGMGGRSGGMGGQNIQINNPNGTSITINQSSNMPGQSRINISSGMGGNNQRRANRQQAIFDQFFRPFNLTSMFNDNQFQNMAEEHDDFNPHEFGMNFSQNFRSSMPRRGNQNMFGQQQQNSQQQSSDQDPRIGFFQQFMQGRRGGGGGQRQQMSYEDFATLIRRAMEESAARQEEAARRPTDERFLSRMPEVPVEEKHCKKNESGEKEMPTCSVCMCDFELGDKANFLPCGHMFHPDCLKPWLKDHNTCPVCRKELPSSRN